MAPFFLQDNLWAKRPRGTLHGVPKILEIVRFLEFLLTNFCSMARL